ncbi:hypothetical protein [Thermaerobacter marianensis]|uniref:hypothetical protein n=1 Tax=Thermaerobacter marianensis TaxID=73919 RepID=UPI0005A8E6EE|nr:hypothetical protein [Thermaerobacter marianensis]
MTRYHACRQARADMIAQACTDLLDRLGRSESRYAREGELSMEPAPDFIIRCPREGCTAHYRVRRYASGNTLGARVWTDGRIAAPMWPEEPEITRCDACGAYFWLDQAPKVAVAEPIVEDYDAEGRRVGRDAGEWDVPDVRFLSPREHLEALASGDLCATPEQERRLRWLLWWADNDRYRQDEPLVAARSSGDWLDEEQVRKNRLRLYDLLDERQPVQRLAKAEPARQLGWFAHARELLDWPWLDEHREFAERIRQLAEAGDPAVREVTRPPRRA